MKILDLHKNISKSSYLISQAEKRTRTELRRQMEIKRMAAWRPIIEGFGTGSLPFICLQYKDKEAVQYNIPAVYIGKLSSFSVQNIMNQVSSKTLGS